MKKNVVIHDKLNQFLVKHRAKRKFVNNIKNLEFGAPEPNNILSAFPWTETPEGAAYWSGLSGKYRETEG